jgi:hypothetical protein
MNAVARIEQQDQLPQQVSSIDNVLAAALRQDDVDLDRVERFLALKREYEADEARKAYVAAMAKFKAKPLTILKDKHVKFTKRDNTTTEYDHATIGNVVRVICAGLGEEGFSHRWDTKQDASKITVTCVITHERGHSESTALTASPDDSGGKNGIQSIASTVTYLQRYTLLAATGMATSDQDDDDGRTANCRKPIASSPTGSQQFRNAPTSLRWTSAAPNSSPRTAARTRCRPI